VAGASTLARSAGPANAAKWTLAPCARPSVAAALAFVVSAGSVILLAALTAPTLARSAVPLAT